jgi:hypothetical protein
MDALQRLLLPLADLFMIVMLSRPPSGTLRTTRVTTVSLVLATATCAASLALAALLLAEVGRHGLLLTLPASLLALVAVGSAALALFGARQRR